MSTKTNTSTSVKDDTVAKLIPEQISECALYLERTDNVPCMDSKGIEAVSMALGISSSASKASAGDGATIIDEAKAQLNCNSERCVVTKLARQIGPGLAKQQLDTYFKILGPTDSQLLNNIHIDNVMKQWGLRYSNFFPFNFNMRNYASYSYDNGHIVNKPDTLATIAWSDLYDGSYDGRKYNCCGCIINTDVYQGEGKHWMALFADARGHNWTVEFFNSSGNAPAPEWVNWLEKTKGMMENIMAGRGSVRKSTGQVSILKVTSIRHQRSKSECGMYSLFYIWARLHDVPAEYFTTNPVPDQLMFEFRQHLFDDPAHVSMKRFDWDKYKNTVKIEWEKK